MAATNAQLQARIAQLEAELAQARRDRFYGNLWANKNMREGKRDPIETGIIRLVVNDTPVWFDVKMWDADPSKFESNPPVHGLCLQPTREEHAAKEEAKWQAAHAS